MQHVPEHSVTETYNGGPDPCYYDPFKISKEIVECRECGWWAFHGYADDTCTGGDGAHPHCYTYEKVLSGVAREYNLVEESVPLHLLRSWLRRHPEHLAHVNPHAFERLMADCFKDYYSDAEVVHLGRHSNDGGVDIKLVMADNTSVLVQVKRRSNLASSEGVETVRQLNGVLLHQGVARGIVVTTARQYTEHAHQEANPSEPPLGRYRVDLLAFDDVVDMLKVGKESEKPGWNAFLKDMTVPDNRSGIEAGVREVQQLAFPTASGADMFDSIQRSRGMVRDEGLEQGNA